VRPHPLSPAFGDGSPLSRLYDLDARIVLVGVGLLAWGFAAAADQAQDLFKALIAAWPYAPLLVTPLGFMGLAWMTRRYAPAARGSGIPQIIAAARHVENGRTGGLGGATCSKALIRA